MTIDSDQTHAPEAERQNQPPFDPLNPTPAEESDMAAGYMDAWQRKPPARDSLAYAWGRGSAGRDRGDEPDAQRRDVERRSWELYNGRT
jgi:hypothetical protein